MLRLRSIAALLALTLLGACIRLIPESPAPPPASAMTLAIASGAPVMALRFTNEDAAGALTAFAASCRAIANREDVSGLTRPADWRAPCEAATNWPAGSARLFLNRYFTPVRVGDGAAFATGYFELEILGSRTQRPGFDVPVYGVPDDLVKPYFDRTEIEEGALAGRGLEIAWAADPVEFFFLQIQGSGRLRTPEGEIIRIGYAEQNGHAYTGIGGLMRERGLLGDGPGQYAGSMQGIMQYLREQPEAGRALMRENKSWVFFRELTGDGPLGSLGVAVTAENSVAVDPRYVPYGAPVWLDLDRDEADGLWVAQDTGGAIKGANRFDTFWGAGAQARHIAGGMSGRGEALILLPKSAVARLTQ